MNKFTNKTAVITGGASGIGLAVARLAAAKGMQLVLADIEQQRLEAVVAELKAAGHAVIGVVCDVAQSADINQLADQAFATFGGVHFLFNNAGVGGAGANIWETTAQDWEWVLGVNVWSIIHAMNAFVPRMLTQDQPSYIVNTASIAGLISGPSMGAYRVSKHAVVAISETLYHELGQKEAQIGVSVLCPAWVKTDISISGRNRPNTLENSAATSPIDPLIRAQLKQANDAVQVGTAPEEIAEAVFAAMQNDEFYILPHPKFSKAIAIRMKDILEAGRNPTNLMLPRSG